jgi:MFS family permease
MRHRFQSNRPFPVQSWPGYYGWVILFFGTIGMIAAVPGSPPGMAVFIDGMIESLSIDRERFSLAYMLGTISAGLVAPYAGTLIDRYGSRVMACGSFFSLGLVLVFTGLVDRVHGLGMLGLSAEWYAFLLICIAFAGIRLIGVGFAMTTCRSMVFKWFEGRRGMAAAINGVVLSLSFSSAPILLNGFVVDFGWQQTWLWLGLLFSLAMFPLAYVFYRDSPESCGVKVEQGDATSIFRKRIPVYREMTGPEAIRTYTFWVFTAALALNALIGTGVSFHIIAIGADSGLDRSEAVEIFLPVAIFHIATTLMFGLFADKVRMKYGVILMVSAQLLSLYGIANVGEGNWKWLFIVGSGVGWGCFGILINVPWPRFFGRRHLGAVNGWVTGATVVTSALGPFLFSLSDGRLGSFFPALVACALLCPLVLGLAIFADNPQQRYASGGKKESSND